MRKGSYVRFFLSVYINIVASLSPSEENEVKKPPPMIPFTQAPIPTIYICAFPVIADNFKPIIFHDLLPTPVLRFCLQTSQGPVATLPITYLTFKVLSEAGGLSDHLTCICRGVWQGVCHFCLSNTLYRLWLVSSTECLFPPKLRQLLLHVAYLPCDLEVSDTLPCSWTFFFLL